MSEAVDPPLSDKPGPPDKHGPPDKPESVGKPLPAAKPPSAGKPRPKRRPGRLLMPEEPPPGPFRRPFWRSPVRGPWLTSVLGLALLGGITIGALIDVVVAPPTDRLECRKLADGHLAFSDEVRGANPLIPCHTPRIAIIPGQIDYPFKRGTIVTIECIADLGWAARRRLLGDTKILVCKGAVICIRIELYQEGAFP